MSFGLKQAKTPAAEIDRRVRAAAEVLQIDDYLDRSPKHLSGGQCQRVAIGRAIVRDPQVFLFDEPLSNLDAALRVQTRLEIARLHERLKSTMIYVTHDQVEAMTLADKIVVLRDGQIEQVGSPMQLYQTPANAFVAQFIGSPKMNFFTCGDLKKPTTTACTTGIRPEHLTLADSDTGQIEGRLELVEQLGEYTLAHLITPLGAEFMVKLPTSPLDQISKTRWFNALPEVTHHFDTDNGQRLDF
jgi:alpha-glucoside transport system ATP-binding protein